MNVDMRRCKMRLSMRMQLFVSMMFLYICSTRVRLVTNELVDNNRLFTVSITEPLFLLQFYAETCTKTHTTTVVWNIWPYLQLWHHIQSKLCLFSYTDACEVASKDIRNFACLWLWSTKITRHTIQPKASESNRWLYLKVHQKLTLFDIFASSFSILWASQIHPNLQSSRKRVSVPVMASEPRWWMVKLTRQ